MKPEDELSVSANLIISSLLMQPPNHQNDLSVHGHHQTEEAEIKSTALLLRGDGARFQGQRRGQGMTVGRCTNSFQVE